MSTFEQRFTKMVKFLCVDPFVRPFGKTDETEREDSDMPKHEKPELEPATETCNTVTDEIPDGITRELGDLPPGADYAPEMGGGEAIDFGSLPPEMLLTKKGLAGILHCTGKTIERLVEKNELPPSCLRMRGRGWWRAGQIQAHIEARIRQAAEDVERLSRRPV